jgi:hypothetical protein
MRVLTVEDVTGFGNRIAKLNPRVRRGFLQSLYTGIRQHELCVDDYAVNGLMWLFLKYGYRSLAMNTPLVYVPNLVGLKITAIGKHSGGPAAGYQTLSLGDKVVNAGPGWSVSEPVCAIVVPGNDGFGLGQVLNFIPKDAVPCDVFFARIPEAT